MRHSSGLIGLALSLLAVPALAQQDTELLHLRLGRFDPVAPPAIPAQLESPDSARLWVLQFRGVPTEAGRQALRELGAEVHGYLPEHAYVLRADAKVAAAARGLATTRALLPYHPAFRLEPFLVNELLGNVSADIPTRRYNLVVVDKRRDKPALARAIAAMGGTIEHEQPGSILFEATLNGAQLLRAAQLDQVLFIDRWTPAEEDMDNGRIQGGGNHVETQGGYTGKGINGHIYEGIEAGHKDFTNTAGQRAEWRWRGHARPLHRRHRLRQRHQHGCGARHGARRPALLHAVRHRHVGLLPLAGRRAAQEDAPGDVHDGVLGQRPHARLHVDFGGHRRHHLRPRHDLDAEPVERG